METILGSLQWDSPPLQFIGKWGYYIYSKRELVKMEIHLILAALMPIYTGAHASLRCPPSASQAKEDEDGEDVEVAPQVEGLQPSDAIVFPILAGCTLAGLYYLIKWLEDPAILNKLLGYYFSLLGTFGVGRILADFLNLSISITLPRLLPTLTQRLLFKSYIHRIVSVKQHIKLQSVIGFILGFLAVTAYNFLNKPWWLTNLIGWGFCYSSLQFMSPTTFWTGTLILSGLFVYDITMVFYTPLMITVATAIDGPIKLVFPGPGRGSMLGLGDIVLPGIMMALALRFDLYLHYLRLQTRSASPSESAEAKKAPYIEATGAWGSLLRGPLPGSLDASTFKKTYFHASLIGYTIGMLTTLIVLHKFNHAQPALLYLVPGVLVSLWGTALVKGEASEMWQYTEDGSLADPFKEATKEGKGKADKTEEEKKGGEKKAEPGERHIFLLSLTQVSKKGASKKVAKEA
ncbi:signal peptide peptidase-domain-containing protein [Bisporella sp. PMI_857]|nr:signal peptide peptidase-domain-containing protein [Bisporella sp. PMI_857]